MANEDKKVDCIFVNEMNNPIEMSVSRSAQLVRVQASGPTSILDHTWTVVEAHNLMTLLSEVLGAPGTQQAQG